MQTRAETLWLAAGAVAGGVIVGLFPPEPRWLWPVVGGVAGGALGLGAARLAGLRWHWALRAAAIVVVLGVGFGSLFLVIGGQWITNPKNWIFRSQ
jgi:hypothetical protein